MTMGPRKHEGCSRRSCPPESTLIWLGLNMAEHSRERWSVCQQYFVSRERNDKAMRQTTQITIEHIVVASDRSYEQVIEALEAQLGLRADWEKIARALITPNASWEQAVQIVEQRLGTSGFTILSKIEPGALLCWLPRISVLKKRE